MRALVVEQDHLVRRVRRDSVDFLACGLGGEIAVLREQLTRDRARDFFEVLDACEPKIAEQDRAVLVVPRFDLVKVASRPVGEIDTLCRGLDHQREWVPVDRAGLDQFRHVDGLASHRSKPERRARLVAGLCLAQGSLLSTVIGSVPCPVRAVRGHGQPLQRQLPGRR